MPGRGQFEDTLSIGEQDGSFRELWWVSRYGQITHQHLQHFTFAWYTMPMATIGLSVLIAREQHDFSAKYALGLVVFFIGLVELCLVMVGTSLRFVFHKHSLHRAITSSKESIYLSAFWISMANLINGTISYAQPHENSRLATCLHVLFWVYLACVYVHGTVIYFTIFNDTHKHLMGRNMTPTWLLPILPVVLSGSIAGNLAPHLTSSHRYPILIGGLISTGMGFLISLPMAAIYLHRLFEVGLPDHHERPGMFVAVGPPTFSGLNWITIAAAIPMDYGYFRDRDEGFVSLNALALVMAIVCWGFGLWVWFIALYANLSSLSKWRLPFRIAWYSFIFPNVGFIQDVIVIGETLPSSAVGWIGSAGTIVLTAVWIVTTVTHLVAIVRGNTLTDK